MDSNPSSPAPERNLRDLFPVIGRHTWLNHAAISPWPEPVCTAMAAFVADNVSQGPLGYGRWLQVEQALRQRAPGLFSQQDPDSIALVANTGTGLNRIARGLDWRTGDSVVYIDGDFPSNVLPWQSLAALGVQPRPVRLDPHDPERSLIAAIGPSTRLLAVSSVHYETGLRLDLPRLGKACSRHGVLFCIDAIQHLGALPLDVDAAQADFVVAGSHKWLLAPEGIALFWSRPEARDCLNVVDPGWRMFADPFNFQRPDWAPPGTALRFEPGTLNTAAIHGLEASVSLLLEIGMNRIGAELLDRTDLLTKALESVPGVWLTSPIERERRAGIVSLVIDGIEPERALAQMTMNGIHAAVRGRCLRLSPHFYTPIKQLELAIDVIKKVSK